MKCTDNRLVALKYQWFRTARLVRKNNDCVMGFYLFLFFLAGLELEGSKKRAAAAEADSDGDELMGEEEGMPL